MQRRFLLRATVAIGATAVLVLAVPLAASAHVRITPDTATPGSSAILTFRVPNESATATTVKLEVDFPTDTPFTSVSYQPVPGWSAQVVTEKLPKPVKITGATVTEAPAKIIWTAQSGTQIGASQFQQFVVSASPVPDTGSVLLPAHQTYSDGTVVDWSQKTPASGDEPEHPAPTLYINDPVPGGAAASTATASVSTSSTSGADVSTSSTAGATDTLALILGIAGLALGAIALVVAVFAATRRRAGTETGGR